MTFSDDDLKRLKESMDAKPESLFISCFEIQDMQALLARLEAAEELAQEAMCHCKYDCDECGKMKTAWQKSKWVSK